MDVADRKWPFLRPEGNECSMFIQWKGTDICIDLTCRCGTWGHFDGFFAHRLRCPTCKTVYELNTQVMARVVEDDDPLRTQELELVG